MKIILSLIITGFIAVGGYLTYDYLAKNGIIDTTLTKGGYISEWVFNVDDLYNVLGASEYATVVEIVDEKERTHLNHGVIPSAPVITPYILYNAKSLYNIKGSLEGDIIVAQENNGFEMGHENAVVYSPLIPNQTYVLSLQYHTELSAKHGYDVYIISSYPNGAKKVDLPTTTPSIDSITENETVQTWMDAYENQNEAIHKWLNEEGPRPKDEELY